MVRTAWSGPLWHADPAQIHIHPRTAAVEHTAHLGAARRAPASVRACGGGRQQPQGSARMAALAQAWATGPPRRGAGPDEPPPKVTTPPKTARGPTPDARAR